ncbi:MAG: hypothetical protein EZS28_050962, partial [Streblomastix strix]
LPATVQELAQPVVDATVEIYQETYSTFLPTPSKSHYTFNLRDASSLASGVLHSSSGYQSSLILVKLWAHEGCRVFRAGAWNDANVIDDKDEFDMPPLSEPFDIEEKPNQLVFADFPDRAAQPQINKEFKMENLNNQEQYNLMLTLTAPQLQALQRLMGI